MSDEEYKIREANEFDRMLFQNYNFMQMNSDLYRLKEENEKLKYELDLLKNLLNYYQEDKDFLFKYVEDLMDKMKDLDKYLNIAKKLKNMEQDFNEPNTDIQQ